MAPRKKKTNTPSLSSVESLTNNIKIERNDSQE